VGRVTEREFRARTADGTIVGWRTDESGPRALVLHGGPGMSDYLETLVAELAGVLTMARFQQRGLEPSVVEGTRDVEAHVVDVIAVLDSLGWNRAWLLGHSWGGHLAMHVAVAHPERALGLMVIDGLGAVGDGGMSALGPNLTAALSPEDLERELELDDRDNRGVASEADKREQMSLVWPYYFGDPGSAPPMPAFRMDTRSIETWDSILEHFDQDTLAKGLPALNMPVLITHGEKSPVPSVEAERTAALMPQARLVIQPGLGHFPWLEAPGSVRDAVVEFIGSG
jgi:pimeloyl-ACP methyl ester carboxylesterase